MRALVATPRFLLLVDIEARRVSVVADAQPEYYGITWRPGGTHLILSHSGLDNEALIDLRSYALSEVGWISEGEQQSPRFLSQPHQILCGPDGRVICTNTGRNSVVVVDLERPGHFQEARLHEDRWDRLEPSAGTGLHLNSLFLRDGRLDVLAHGFEAGSQLITLDYPSLEVREIVPVAGTTGMHNCCVTERGERLACVSSRGMLVDPHTLDVRWRSGSGGYLRGMAVGADRVLLGESPQTGRHLRASAVSGVWVIDRSTWQTVDYLELGPYGVVNEVRLLDVPDEAHHGHPFAGVASLVDRDVSRCHATERVQASRVLADLTTQGPFDMVLGAPHVSADGWWLASGELCLLLTRQDGPHEVGLRYAFGDDAEGGQCGVVVGSRPQDPGSCPSLRDTDMDVIVATQQGGDRVSLAHWRHDGTGWGQVRVLAEVVGLDGRLVIRPAGSEIAIHAGPDEHEVARMPRCDLPYADGPWGVRWQAMRIVPEHRVVEPAA